MIVMIDTCTINVSLPKLVSSISIVNMVPQFGASLTDDSRVIIDNCNMFIIKATSHVSTLCLRQNLPVRQVINSSLPQFRKKSIGNDILSETSFVNLISMS